MTNYRRLVTPDMLVKICHPERSHDIDFASDELCYSMVTTCTATFAH